MTPEEWLIAAPMGQAASPAHAAGHDRLRTVRVDFFLPPQERLSEQERALMTAMLHCLVEDLATSLRASLPTGLAGANDDAAELIETLTRAGLLDEPELIGLLLQRAEEERIGSAARARSGRREARAVQALISHEDGQVSAAAMQLILARGRRRNRFGQCLVAFDDLPLGTAERLANAVAAALALQGPSSRSQGRLAPAAATLVAAHDPGKSADGLTSELVRRLHDAGALTDELLLACAQEGELLLIGAAAAELAGVRVPVALGELLSGESARVARFMRVAGFSRPLAAGILASLGDLLGVEDAGSAIAAFDAADADQIETAKDSLAASPAFRAAAEALGVRRG